MVRIDRNFGQIAMKVLLLVTCLATVAFGCSNTCPGDNGGTGQCQPVKIQYSANGVCLNVEVGCPGAGNGNTTPPTKYEKCGSCDGLTYGRVPLDGDCSQFCECIRGQHSNVDSCPNGLSFNAKSQVCDFPENSGCSNEVIVTPLPPDDDARYCESCAGINYGFVAFEKNCSKFCECLNGEVSKLKNCEDGLFFNKEIDNCDYAGNRDCQARPTYSTPSVTPNVTTTTNTPETPIVTPKGEECIKCNAIDHGVVGDNDDCRKFCICFQKDVVLLNTCSEGLYFNPESEVCEYDSLGVCADEVTTNTTNTSQNTPMIPIVDGVDGNCKLCDEANLGKLVPIEGDCTKFCVCQYYSYQGKNTVKTCNAGLYFNPTLQVCDWPINSGCVQN